MQMMTERSRAEGKTVERFTGDNRSKTSKHKPNSPTFRSQNDGDEGWALMVRLQFAGVIPQKIILWHLLEDERCCRLYVFGSLFPKNESKGKKYLLSCQVFLSTMIWCRIKFLSEILTKNNYRRLEGCRPFQQTTCRSARTLHRLLKSRQLCNQSPP